MSRQTFDIGRQMPAQRKGYGSVPAAARWLLENRRALRAQKRHAVPELQREFGLSPKEAVEAIREAELIRARAT